MLVLHNFLKLFRHLRYPLYLQAIDLPYAELRKLPGYPVTAILNPYYKNPKLRHKSLPTTSLQKVDDGFPQLLFQDFSFFLLIK